VEFLGISSLEILKWGNEPTFCNGYRSEVIDITLGSSGLLENIDSWEVPMEPSLSNHRHILFTLQGSVPVRLVRNPRGTEWGSFWEELKEMLSRGPVGCTGNEAGLGLALNRVQYALIKNNCPVQLIKPASTSLRWTARLESLRRGVRRLFNKS
jgi:hypothetical protein